MKKKAVQTTLLVLLLLVSASVLRLSAQTSTVYPVDVNALLTPPYDPCLKNYVGTERFQCHLLLRDMGRTEGYRFRIRLTVRTMGGGVVFRALSDSRGVRPGMPVRNLGATLFGEFFKPENIESGARYKDGCLPGGAYNFSFQVVDDNDRRRIPISRESSFVVFLEHGGSPQLIHPADGDSLCSLSAVNFLWQQPFATGEINQYRFELAPVPQGSSPAAALQYGESLQGYVKQETAMPMHMLPVTANITEKTTYAWRVTLLDRNGQPRSDYPNGGSSQVFSFVYCGEKQSVEPYVKTTAPQRKRISLPDTVRIDTVLADGAEACVRWRLDSAAVRQKYSGYSVEVRKASQDSWSGFLVEAVDDSVFCLPNLKYNERYQTRVQYFRTEEDGTLAYAPYSDTLGFVVPNPTDTADCGEVSPLSDCGGREGAVLSVGDYIIANGSKIQIDSISYNASDKSVISGTGYVNFPILKGLRLKMKFTDIRVNCAGELAEGDIVSVYDKANSATLDLNRLIGKGDAGAADAPNTPVQMREAATLEEAERIASVGDFVCVGGAVFMKDSEGRMDSVGRKISLAGIYDNTGNLDETGGFVRFSNSDPTVAFDDDARNVYRKVGTLSNDYPYFGNDRTHASGYIIPWLALNPGRAVGIDAAWVDKGNYTDVKFIAEAQGNDYLELKSTTTPSGYVVTVPGKAAGTGMEVYAVARRSEGEKYVNVGKLRTANFERRTHRLVIVPVAGADRGKADAKAVEAHLDTIYGRLGVKWEVRIDEPFDNEAVRHLLSDGFGLDAAGRLDKESSDMLSLRHLYFGNSDPADGTAYLFLLDEATGAEGVHVSGDMPQNRPVGYLFAKGIATKRDFNRTVAHELGHGVYNLDHTFEGAYNMPQGHTDNLMDYVDGEHLAHYQWKLIDRPGFAWALLEKDEDGMKRAAVRQDDTYAMCGGVNDILYYMLNTHKKQVESDKKLKDIFLNDVILKTLKDYGVNDITNLTEFVAVEAINRLFSYKVVVGDYREAVSLVTRYINILSYEQFVHNSDTVMERFRSNSDLTKGGIKGVLDEMNYISIGCSVTDDLLKCCASMYDNLNMDVLYSLKGEILEGKSNITSEGVKYAMLRMSNKQFKTFVRGKMKDKMIITGTQMAQIVSDKNKGVLSKIVSELTNPKGLGKTDMNKLFKDFNEADLCGLLSKQENFDKSYLDDFYKSIKKGKSIKNVSNVLNEVGTTITVAIWAYNFFKNGDIPSPVDLISSVYWPVGLFSTMVIDDIAEKMEAEVLASMLDDCDWSNVVDWRKYRKKINVPDQELYLYYVYCEQGCTYNPNIIPTSIVVKERQLAYEIFGFYPTHVTFYLGGPDTHSDGKPNTVVKYEGK